MRGYSGHSASISWEIQDDFMPESCDGLANSIGLTHVLGNAMQMNLFLNYTFDASKLVSTNNAVSISLDVRDLEMVHRVYQCLVQYIEKDALFRTTIHFAMKTP